MNTMDVRSRTQFVSLDGIGRVEVEVSERGEGRPVLLLHGGGGPMTVSGFADQLAAELPGRVITPVHPGFGGTLRPGELDSVRGLAALYCGLLAELDLVGVTVVGNSVGGWIAAEMALLDPSRTSGFVLVDAVGIVVAGHPVMDFFSLTMDQVAEYSYYEPDRFRINLDALPAAARQVMAGNRAALAAYAGADMADASLASRLAGVVTPTLVVWGESDRIADPDFGRALAAAIPESEFRLLSRTGHLPQLESPDALVAVLRGFVAQHAAGRPVG